METLEQQFNSRVRVFLGRTGVSPTTFGMKALGDAHLVRQLDGGRSPSLRTADRVAPDLLSVPEVDEIEVGRHRPQQRFSSSVRYLLKGQWAALSVSRLSAIRSRIHSSTSASIQPTAEAPPPRPSPRSRPPRS